MKLWLISQAVNTCYDTYDSAVVAAETAVEAQQIHPGGEGSQVWSWAEVGDVVVVEIGEALEGTQKGVICASFNAG